MSKKNTPSPKKFWANNREKKSEKVNEAIEIPKKSFFQRWFRWDVITGVATLLMLFIAIYTINPGKDPVIDIKNRILSNINVVESTFKPSELKVDNDSSKYLSLLADLQQSTIDYCILWKSLNDAEPYSKYCDLPPSEIVNILSKEYSRIVQQNNAASSVIAAIRDIQSFELLNDSSNITNISHAKQNDILSFVVLKNEIMSKAQDKCKEYLTKATDERDSNREYKKYLKMGLESLDEVKDEVDYYKMDDAIIDYAIECNKLFTISKRYYIDK